MQKVFKFKARLWVWPGDTPWHFVSLDQDISNDIRNNYPKASMVKVEAEILSIKWTTSLFRNSRDKNYLLPIKKDVRKKSGVQDGEVIDIEIRLL